MKIIVIGAGVIGISTAYFLAKDGYEVVVIDKNSKPGSETSFANGGQISVCYSEPLASIFNLNKIISGLGKESSSILFKPQMNIDQWTWCSKFLWQCLPFNNNKNIKELLGLSLYSRNTLQEMRQLHGDKLNYNYSQAGILNIYTSQEDFINGQNLSRFMNQFGCERIVKNSQDTLSLVPQLQYSKIKIFGSDFSPQDESGDANLYCIQLEEICRTMGVVFLYNHEALQFQFYDDGHIEEVYIHPTLKENETYSQDKVTHIKAKAFILATASLTAKLSNPLGINTSIYPVKGYSATLNIIQDSLISDISITDNSHKIVLTKIKNQLRIAGTYELNGFNYDLNTVRCNALVDRAKELLHSESVDFNNPIFWTGLSPTTPSLCPIIKKTQYDNLFINAGHGTLGFTLASGSGKIMSQIIKKYFLGLN